MFEKIKVDTAVKVLSGISVGTALIKDTKSRYDAWALFTAKVESNSYVYPPLKEWLSERTKTKNLKFDAPYHGVKRFYDGVGKATIEVSGHPLKVSIEKPDITTMSSDMESPSQEFLVFTSRTRAGIDALENLLNELINTRRTAAREPMIYSPSTYGWEGYKFAYRNIDSVVLPEGEKEDLLADLEAFFSNEERYEKIGVPWHRGYLFHGPPGNGKTSVAAAVAHKYRLNLYNMPLSSVKSDKDLATNISRIQDNSILLLEDIDIFSNSMGRTQSKDSPTLAGLLNALDGVATPHGLLTFMTTNHVENLDAALIRPGRIDKKVELTAPDAYQVKALFLHAYGEDLSVEPKNFNSVAELSNVLKMYPMDAEAARLEIKA